MSPSNWARSLDGRTLLVVLAVAVLVLTAGCLGLGDSGGDDPEMDGNETQDGQNGEQEENGQNGENGADGQPESTVPANASAWLAQFDDIEQADDTRPVEELAADAVTEAESVSGYEYSRQTTVEQQARSAFVVATTDQETVVNVTAEELSYTRTVVRQGNQSISAGYLQEGTLYERSSRSDNLSDVDWIQRDLGENYDSFYRQFNVLNGFAEALDNGSVRIEGTAEVEGEQTTVLRTDVRETLGSSAEGADVDQSVLLLWVSDDSDRIVRAASFSRVFSSGGDAEQRVANEFSLSFDAVDITVPDDAKNASR